MGKRSRLREKAARMPDVRQARWEQVVSAYLESVRSQQSEPAKSQRFLLLLKELFGLQPGFIEDYVAGVERYVKVKQKDRILRGRIDNLFGNLVIEFERDLTKTQREAEEQLRRYIAVLWSQEEPGRRAPYLCIATDGVHFAVYSPTVQDGEKAEVQPDEVRLRLVERVDWSDLKAQEVYFWLDRYFLRREIFSPKTENIVKDFGLRSHAFQVAGQTLLSLWDRLKCQPEFSVVYENWEKYLLIVYGSSVADEELFIRHTYLSMLAKLMAWRRLTGERTAPNDEQILSLLEGRFFKEHGIENFLEEDFFSWIARGEAREAGVETARMLLSLLQNYNLRELSEDVLKSLYQELVDPATRHDLGEYYTPDWLAHRMVRRLLDENPEGAILDPACGSGTFLYLAVREKRERLGDTRQTLEHILDSVVGVDIHPLAVTVAKTNYILALGDLLAKRRGKINIPVYLADTIRLPERWADTPMADYEVTIDDQTIYLPQALLESPDLYDEAIEAAKEFAVQNVGRQPTGEQFANYLRAQRAALLEAGVPVQKLFVISKALRALIESRRDTIWAFVLKNIYKPLFLRRKFDFVVGNPPWLSYRYVERGEYQRFLKRQITEEYNLLSGKAELITQMELGTLFFVRAADLYLKPGGAIAFVLPRSIFTADQHDAFRRKTSEVSETSEVFGSLKLRIEEVWDLEEVEPLFNVPACVVLARKEERPEISYPLLCRAFRGMLPRKNADLGEAAEALEVLEEQLFLNRRGERTFWATRERAVLPGASPYRGRFSQGATLVPRSCWFVEVKASPLGFDPSLPPLETAERARRQAKAAYRGLVMKGNVEGRFLYATLLSTDLLPFGHLPFRLVVLPIEPRGKDYTLLTAEEARGRGYLHLARWLEVAQAEWERRRGEKAERMDVLEWLDYRHKLTAQNPQARYRVLYPTSATYMCACVVENRPIEFKIEGQTLEARGVVANERTYHFETDDKPEAHYLAAVLNAPFIDQQLKPMQSRGQWGPRDIHKKVLELPIPRFDPGDAVHRRLAELGKECTQKVAEWLESGGPGKIRSIGRLRSMVREILAGELEEIDGLVRKIMGE